MSRNFFFIATISIKEAFYFPVALPEHGLWVIFGISEMQTRICLPSLTFMFHICLYVSEPSTRFFDAGYNNLANESFLTLLMQNVGNLRIF